MKRNLMFLFVLLAGVMLGSCKKDDPKIDLPGPIRDSQTYSFGISAPQGAIVTLEKTMHLADFTKLGTYQRYVYEGALQTASFFEFAKGSAENIELKKVTLSLKENGKVKYELGTITKDQKYDTLDDLNFLQQVINELVRRKSVTLQLSYETENAITTEVKFHVKADVTFKLRQ